MSEITVPEPRIGVQPTICGKRMAGAHRRLRRIEVKIHARLSYGEPPWLG